ncbi:MAG: Rpn family recombination-promoting nuclease/putative transposase [Lachnospiraceae bacterium]|nr:Rpn family recombination-promoting nuclease/putative transposase [Lachnospiraceae bacterium]
MGNKKKLAPEEVNRLSGSMESLSALQITADTAGLNAECRAVLHSREVLAVILQETVEEYKGYSVGEIMDFIETDSITESREVSAGRTNTQIRSDNPEFVQLNEKTSKFDVVFRAKNPRLSAGKVIVNLHINLEPQKTYRPGYPVEKRGMYYLARGLSSQLSLVTNTTDYNQLEKCYSIWICRDDIPSDERYSISFYKMVNTKNIGQYVSDESIEENQNCDLLELVIIRLGDAVYHGKEEDEGFGLLRFLNAIMYPHQHNFMETISEYIDYSDNEELWKRAEHMEGLGESILEEGFEQGIEQGICLMVEALQEVGQTKKYIMDMLVQKYMLPEDVAEAKTEQYWR